MAAIILSMRQYEPALPGGSRGKEINGIMGNGKDLGRGGHRRQLEEDTERTAAGGRAGGQSQQRARPPAGLEANAGALVRQCRPVGKGWASNEANVRLCFGWGVGGVLGRGRNGGEGLVKQ